MNIGYICQKRTALIDFGENRGLYMAPKNLVLKCTDLTSTCFDMILNTQSVPRFFD